MMFELLLDVMERTCEMPGCLGKNCIAGAKWHNINLKRFIMARSHRIGAHTATDQTVPYGTGLWGWRCPRHCVPGRLRRLRRARQPWVCATTFYGRDVGFAESGYDRTVPPGHFAIGNLSNCRLFWTAVKLVPNSNRSHYLL